MDLFATTAINEIIAVTDDLCTKLIKMDDDTRIAALNEIRRKLHEVSPFKAEPVDCIQWIKADSVQANDYNPNAVAPPEMKLLEHSIKEDGYTQPIVSWVVDGAFEVVDGFHRNRVGKESKIVRERVKGYLPLVIINAERQDRNDRIAATIRHNRARGKHQVSAMSDIVVELKRRNWSNERIGNELGMDPDEVLRLMQIAGLAEMFSNRSFSEAWEHTGPMEEQSQPVEDGERFDLDWVSPAFKPAREAGWYDRSENSSVFYGENGKHLGAIQRSRFKEEWFWYAYVQPMKQGRVETREEAVNMVEGFYK